ncbi:carbohydrate-binding module family 21 protein [Collybiopsis luxurians FD-317 M1]|nr:carbohydrate-binding module family 21 protein [Collybiopsis luxurians FD-317 M1]
MPYSVPTPPPSSLSATPIGSPPATPKRSLSSQSVPTYSFSNENGPGAFTSLGSLPRRGPGPSLAGNPKATSAIAKRFHIKASSGTSSSSSSEDESELGYLSAHHPNQPFGRKDNGGDDDGRPPPLKLRVDRLGSPTFNGVPFPRSSPLSSPLPGASSPISSTTWTPSGPPSPLNELDSEIKGLPSNDLSASIPISASNPIYSPYKYSPQDGTALPLPLRPTPTRSSSSPHIGTSGLPLKSSLKSSSSASSIHSHLNSAHHGRHFHSAHQRARSAPTNPGQEIISNESSPSSPGSPISTSSTLDSPTTPKSVHFPSLPIHLERVRVFHKSAKPASLLSVRTGEDTETETETDRGSDWGYGYRKPGMARPSAGSFPFPKMPSSPLTSTNSVWPPLPSKEASEYRSGSMKLQLDMTGYPVPDPSSIPPTTAINILLESISLSSSPPDDKLHVRGTFIVRNLAFQKDVAVRFTMDEWSTVSEIKANWVANLYSPFPAQRSSGKDVNSWDRFSFSINLSDYTLSSLPSKVIYFVGRYTVPGGEYWDNCGGRNWRIMFKLANVEAEKPVSSESSNTVPNVIVSPPSATLPVMSTAAVAAPVLSLSMPMSSNVTSLSFPDVPLRNPPSPGRSEAVAQATAQRLRRFSLSNYSAPSSSSVAAALRPKTGANSNSKISLTSDTQLKESIAADKGASTSVAQPPPSKITIPSMSDIATSPSPLVTPSPRESKPSTPPVEGSSEFLYDWFVKQWCFTEMPLTDQGLRRNEHGAGISRGDLGLEVSGGT